MTLKIKSGWKEVSLFSKEVKMLETIETIDSLLHYHNLLSMFHSRHPSITIVLWNNLNNDIKLCIDVNSFRSKLRGVLLDKFKREE